MGTSINKHGTVGTVHFKQIKATTDFCMMAVLFLSFFFFSYMYLKYVLSSEDCAYLAERHAQGKHGGATKIED